MDDREKVIKGLERCKLFNKVNCDKCPYDYNGRGNGKSECTAELATDALALLKEQQEKIDRLLEESASNAEMAEGYAELLKEQEAEIERLKKPTAGDNKIPLKW